MKKYKSLIFIVIIIAAFCGCENKPDENQPPVASMTAVPSSGTAPLTVAFDASSSYDPDEDSLEYNWNFGDGLSAAGVQTSHTYTNEGIYTAILTVNDGKGATASASSTISVQGDIPNETAFYVSPNGNDQNPGTESLPWKTLQHAAGVCNPGDLIIILPGIYGKGMELSRSGNVNNPIRFRGTAASSVIIDASTDNNRDCFFLDNCEYIIIENITVKNAQRAGIRLSYSHHITIKNCIIKDNARWGIFTDFSNYTTIQDCEASGSKEEHGIYISNSSDYASIKRNRCNNNAASGIQINADPSMGDDGISSGCVIDSNLCFENGKIGGSAVNLASVRDSVISNNVIYNNYAGGIAAWDDGQGDEWGSKNLQILNNTVYFRPGQGRWCVSLKNGSTNAVVNNNLLFGGSRGSIELDDTTFANVLSDYNMLFSNDLTAVAENEDSGVAYTFTEWQNLGKDIHSISNSPQNVLTNVAAFDPHLKLNSPAIDKGIAVNLNEDYEGDQRPLKNGYDIGADEAK